MYGYDPRATQAYGSFSGIGYGAAPYASPAYGYQQNWGGPVQTNQIYGATTWGAPNYGYVPHGSFSAWGQPQTTGFTTPAPTTAEYAILCQRIEEIRHQFIALNDWIRHDGLRHGGIENATAHNMNLGQGVLRFQRPFAFNGNQVEPMRLRESDSHLFCELYLPNITMGDVEVEVHGNRVICRTRIPVAHLARVWGSAQLPRGFDFFELPDGRVEFNWLVNVPFVAKEVEASFREGSLCLCILKSEVTARHTVKVVKETTTGRRAANEMNS